MKIQRPIVIAATAAWLTSCALSMRPWYSPEDITYDNRLQGTWTEEDMRWTFQRKTSNPGYQLTISEDGMTATMTATLFELDEHRYIDITPSDIDEYNLPGLVISGLFPGHLVLHVTGIGSELSLELMDEDWLSEYLDDHPHALKRYTGGERWLLTGSTRRLQRFLRKHVDGGELFSEAFSLEKV